MSSSFRLLGVFSLGLCVHRFTTILYGFYGICALLFLHTNERGIFGVCLWHIFFPPPKKEPTKFHVCQHQYNANFHLLMEMVSYSFWDDHFNFWTIPWKWYALKLICRICSTLVLFICICTLEMQQRYEIWEIYLQFHLSQYFVYITDNNKVMMFYDMS